MKRIHKGMLFSFEGVDGVGKTTQVAMVREWLTGAGHHVKVVREPGGTPLGEALREVVLHLPGGPASPLAEFLVFAAARAELVACEIRPQLEAGGIVLADRYWDSSVAYQVFGRGLERALVEQINRAAVEDCIPTGTIWLDGTVGETVPGDGIESRDAAYFRRVLAGFGDIARRHPERVVRVDARRPPEAVFAEIQSRIAQWLNR